MPKVVEGLGKVSTCTSQESDEHVTAGCSGLHSETCLKYLRKEPARCDFIVTDPESTYREIVLDTSIPTVLV